MGDARVGGVGRDDRRRPGGGLALRVGLASVAAVVALIAAFTTGSPEGAAPAPAGTASNEAVVPETADAADDVTARLEGLARREPGDPLALGDVAAPVVMVSYADFQCPYCGRHARETAPVLVERYVDDGTLRIEWRDFPYLGEASTTAALAGRAAAEQDAFWEFHDALYAASPSDDPSALTEGALVGLAADLGLDADRFRTTMRAPETAAAIEADLVEGQQLGVTGTPAFLVNGQPLLGAHTAEVFGEVIEAAAADR